MSIHGRTKRNADEEVKECHLCGSSIASAARKCSNCGSLFGPGEQASEKSRPPSDNLAQLMVAIPVAASILALLWVARLPVLDDPVSKLSMLAVAVIGLTAATGALESKLLRARMHKDPGGIASFGPLKWLVIGLLWIPGYALYLRTRREFGGTDFTRAAIAASVIFILSFATSGIILKQKQQELLREIEKVELQMKSAPASQQQP